MDIILNNYLDEVRLFYERKKPFKKHSNGKIYRVIGGRGYCRYVNFPWNKFLEISIDRDDFSAKLENDLGHEFGHVVNAANGGKYPSVVQKIANLDRDTYIIIFSDKRNFGEDPDYGSKHYKRRILYDIFYGGFYNPEEETFANLQKLFMEGVDFPEIVRSRLAKHKIGKADIKKIYSLLKQFRNYATKKGYQGNPKWSTKGNLEKKASSSLNQKTASSGIRQNPGGIDLNPAGLEKGDSPIFSGIKNRDSPYFRLSPETIQQWKNGRGVSFEILAIEDNVDMDEMLKPSH